jgi:hypothetical protein
VRGNDARRFHQIGSANRSPPYGAAVDLPPDYESFLAEHPDGVVELHAAAYFEIWGRTRALAANEDYSDLQEEYPGLLLIGSDGASELIGYDTRRSPAPIVLVNAVSEGWHEACWQAATLSDLLAGLRAGQPFRFQAAYEVPPGDA